jgi:hypothetical protein
MTAPLQRRAEARMTAMETTDGPDDGSVHGAFVSRQLDDQRALKDSLERRASAVITTSGVLVTLVFGLATITTKTKGYKSLTQPTSRCLWRSGRSWSHACSR